MNWDAFIVIGSLAFILGILLYIPAHFWLKRKLRKEPHHAKRRVTKAGFIVFGLMVVVLIFGFSQQYLDPESDLGKLVATWLGREIFGLVVALVFGFIVGNVLHARGIELVEEKE